MDWFEDLISRNRTYRTGRVAGGLVEVAGWIAVGFGVFFALLGFLVGGFIGGAMQFGGYAPGVMLRLSAMFPGIGLALVGLGALLYAQHARAAFDTAEMTRELLKLGHSARRRDEARTGHASDATTRRSRSGSGAG